MNIQLSPEELKRKDLAKELFVTVEPNSMYVAKIELINEDTFAHEFVIASCPVDITSMPDEKETPRKYKIQKYLEGKWRTIPRKYKIQKYLEGKWRTIDTASVLTWKEMHFILDSWERCATYLDGEYKVLVITDKKREYTIGIYLGTEKGNMFGKKRKKDF